MESLIFSFFNAEVAGRYWPNIVEGFWITTQLALIVIATGLSVGLFLAVVRSFQILAINWFLIFWIDFFRAAPPLVIIIVLYFAFPLIGVKMSGLVATWLSLSLVLTAFTEEIIWAGILAVAKGQWEAARSTGLRPLQTLALVILPQAIRITIAPLTNRVIGISKGTALGSVVAVQEILFEAANGQAFSGNPTPLTLGAIAYLILFLPIVIAGRWIETRFAWRR